MGSKPDIQQTTLAFTVFTTLETIISLRGYGIARRIEQASDDLLSPNYGTLYPALSKLELEQAIVAEWGISENHRRTKFYKLSRAGKKQLEKETRDWKQPAAIQARFLTPAKEV